MKQEIDMRRMPLRSLALALLLGALATGCAGQSQPSTFYVLSYESPSAGESTMREGLGVGVGPVELPQYLDRSQIVTRSSENQLNIEEFDRWGGRLRENFTTVLSEVLSAELGTDRVSIHPWNMPSQVEIQVIVNVTAFESDASGQSALDARWMIVDSRRQEVLAVARSSLREAIASDAEAAEGAADYDAVAAAMSRNVAALGSEIAAQIKTLRP